MSGWSQPLPQADSETERIAKVVEEAFKPLQHQIVALGHKWADEELAHLPIYAVALASKLAILALTMSSVPLPPDRKALWITGILPNFIDSIRRGSIEEIEKQSRLMAETLASLASQPKC
jgi:hypothetical protein